MEQKNIEQKDELDLTMASWVQEKKMIRDEELAAIQQKFYESSIQSPDKKKRQKVYGKKYIDKEAATLIAKLVIGVAGMIVAFNLGGAITKLDQYNHTLDQKIERIFTLEEQKELKDIYHDPIASVIEAYKSIQTEEDKLEESGKYDYFGRNISGEDKEYLPFDEDSIFTLTEIEQDAIDAATDSKIEEYKRSVK